MKQLLHTPEGVRDIYNGECGKKLTLEQKLHQVFCLYGYQDIQTPTFEFFDVFREEIGTISSKELYRFFDNEGNILALRPDITPSIARVCATLFEEEEMPLRLCYTGNIFINHSSYQGRLKENTQMGAELVGDTTPEADAEMIALVIESMKSVGLKEFQLSVGHGEFLKGLIESAVLSEKEEQKVQKLINNRNFFGLFDFLEKVGVSREVTQAFQSLNELVGGVEILSEAYKISSDDKCVQAVKRLERIYDLLKIYGLEKYITFDLGLSGGAYEYYTGVIFRCYTYGSGDAIVKGGRYDHLIEKFGKEAPSIGFAIVVDEVIEALDRQKIEVSSSPGNTLIVYNEGLEEKAITKAKDLRLKGENVQILMKSGNKEIDDYKDYGKKYNAKSLILITGDENEIFDLCSGKGPAC
ncbi:ATP phosphoribosyltransferase regulatory subunit [Aequitasia blattaphilus]|uniref:ATP phosphoribosyltransferase regulatory subunit n=1 Tax=Aequitasia blattaphilus TaxID=2949332 RepID=A0ABT1E5R0_9FIRM|nr:ATP phosphoribosyltransferase regulatory subunit [Aequitasia blattaphilus]MCP1101088.1 ATP phosphoribosyltransferase regulatory subunit [Aequitasia blattaphilus]MCR8613728.1 ATP phosphoribosyltransferase regulatory subunit [Aequitasia blattaphilus]